MIANLWRVACNPQKLPYKKLVSITLHANNSQIHKWKCKLIHTAMIPMQTCAHRYLIVVGETPYPVGRCFFSGRTLEDFTEYSPCEDGKKNENLYTSMHIW